ncbi:MAG TPA: hypothetical protein VHC43_16690 [Mycobacteriales bacterium]|nr:hypothetical protein [Mycobacteriales bacterium]
MLRPFRTATVAAITTGILLGGGGSAIAAGSSGVVAPHGSVAGKSYGYYVGKVWQVIFESPTKNPDTCATETINGRQVAVVWPAITGSGTFKQTCTEPAGRAIYLQHVADECSTFKGDHGKFGTTDAQLRKCARAEFKNSTGTTTVDGQAISNVDRFIAGSGVYGISLSSRHNYYGYKKHHGRSAAYGFGVLLRGLTTGTHKVVVTGRIPAYKFHLKVTYTIHVQ